MNALQFNPHPEAVVILHSASSDLLLTVQNNGRDLIALARDGTVAYGKGYNPDEAARVFWSAVAANVPKQLRGA